MRQDRHAYQATRFEASAIEPALLRVNVRTKKRRTCTPRAKKSASARARARLKRAQEGNDPNGIRNRVTRFATLRDSCLTFRNSARYCDPSKITTVQIRAELRSYCVRICPKIFGSVRATQTERPRHRKSGCHNSDWFGHRSDLDSSDSQE